MTRFLTIPNQTGPTSVYRVEYSEDFGFYIKETKNVYEYCLIDAQATGWKQPGEEAIPLDQIDGYDESSDGAVEFWREECRGAAQEMREMADSIVEMSRLTPVIPVRIMKPSPKLNDNPIAGAE